MQRIGDTRTYTPLGNLAMFAGHWEILIVAGIVLLLFGNRLPGVMRSMGRGIVEFKKGAQGIEDDIDQDTPTKSVTASQDAEAKEKETVE
jgi:sec-independent protein translocase protein TatA